MCSFFGTLNFRGFCQGSNLGLYLVIKKRLRAIAAVFVVGVDRSLNIVVKTFLDNVFSARIEQ